MITVNDPRLHQNEKGDSITFAVELRADSGELYLRIKGCRIMAGHFYGPSSRLPSGRFVPLVEFFTARGDVLRALAESGWPRDFGSVQFPAAPSTIEEKL